VDYPLRLLQGGLSSTPHNPEAIRGQRIPEKLEIGDRRDVSQSAGLALAVPSKYPIRFETLILSEVSSSEHSKHMSLIKNLFAVHSNYE
jgi:hypothetical protein